MHTGAVRCGGGHACLPLLRRRQGWPSSSSSSGSSAANERSSSADGCTSRSMMMARCQWEMGDVCMYVVCTGGGMYSM